LESRIQLLNSDLFKERAANAELSLQIKDLLSQLEEFRRKSIHQSQNSNSDSQDQEMETSPEENELKVLPTRFELLLSTKSKNGQFV